PPLQRLSLFPYTTLFRSRRDDRLEPRLLHVSLFASDCLLLAPDALLLPCEAGGVLGAQRGHRLVPLFVQPFPYPDAELSLGLARALDQLRPGVDLQRQRL